MPGRKTHNPDNDNHPVRDTTGPANPKPCPICSAPQTQAYRPFCSQRCADVDLSRWLNGAYAIPAAETDGIQPDDDSNQR